MSKIVSIVYSGTRTVGTATFGQVVLVITDAATGLPANGNNVAVNYKMNLNGVAVNFLVNVPGQSIVIYDGKLSDTDPANPYTTYFSINSVGTFPPDGTIPPPAPGVCDLVINSIVVVPESAAGAADAYITINAASSYGGILYSKDNVTFQTSPKFTGMAAGYSGTAYVKDANGCTNSKTFVIPTLNSILVSDPTVTLPNGNVSRWNAAFNPINFIYQRRDFLVTSVDGYTILNSGTYARVQTNADVGTVKAGDLIYINAGAYVGVFDVIQLGAAAGSLVIRTAYSANATGFININRLRPYYKVLTRITYIDKATGLISTIISTNRPNNSGYVKADISNFLQSTLSTKDDSNYTAVNFRDDNLSASYQIEYAEAWDGHTPKYTPIADPYYVVYAAKQLGDQYGGNLAANVPFVLNSSAKWITDFKEPVYNNSLPFDLSFIYGEKLAGRQLYYSIRQLDINRVDLGISSVVASLLNENGSFLLNQDGSKLVIARQNLYNLPIAEHIGLNRLLINAQFADNVYYFTVTLYYDEAGVPVQVTETQTIRIDKEIQLQSFYLRWIGLSGSWNYYRFYYNQQVGLDVNNAVTVKNYVFDWQDQNTIEDVISKQANQKIKLFTEDTSVADIKGLQSIKYSPKVQMLTGTNPVKWQTVIVNTSTFDEYETLNGQAPFSITIMLPSINVQTQ